MSPKSKHEEGDRPGAVWNPPGGEQIDPDYLDTDIADTAMDSPTDNLGDGVAIFEAVQRAREAGAGPKKVARAALAVAKALRSK